MKEAAGDDERDLAEEMSKAFMSEELPEDVFGAPKAGSGMWASLIRIISPVKGNTVAKITLDQNEAAHRYSHHHLFRSQSTMTTCCAPADVPRQCDINKKYPSCAGSHIQLQIN